MSAKAKAEEIAQLQDRIQQLELTIKSVLERRETIQRTQMAVFGTDNYRLAQGSPLIDYSSLSVNEEDLLRSGNSNNANSTMETPPTSTISSVGSASGGSSLFPADDPWMAPRIVGHLVDLYMERSVGVNALLHPATVRRQIKNGTVNQFLLLTILASVCRYSDDPFIKREPAYTSGQEYYERAKSMMPIVIENPCVEHIAGLSLLALYEIGVGRGESSYIYTGLSMRMAQRIGLHVTDDPSSQHSDNWLDLEIKRRIWWRVFITDVIASLGMARTPMMQDADFIVNVPNYDTEFLDVRLRSEYNNTATATATAINTSSPSAANKQDVTTTNLYMYLCKLFIILARIAELVARRRPGRPPFTVEFVQYNKDLEEWMDSLPSDCKFGNYSTMLELYNNRPIHYTSVFFLHSAYLLARILLNRIRPDILHDYLVSDAAFVQYARERLRVAAESFTELCRVLLEVKIIHIEPMFGLSAVHSAFVHVLDLVGSDPAKAACAVESLELHGKMLGKMATHWAMCKLGYRTVYNILAANGNMSQAPIACSINLGCSPKDYIMSNPSLLSSEYKELFDSNNPRKPNQVNGPATMIANIANSFGSAPSLGLPQIDAQLQSAFDLIKQQRIQQELDQQQELRNIEKQTSTMATSLHTTSNSINNSSSNSNNNAVADSSKSSLNVDKQSFTILEQLLNNHPLPTRMTDAYPNVIPTSDKTDPQGVSLLNRLVENSYQNTLGDQSAAPHYSDLFNSSMDLIDSNQSNLFSMAPLSAPSAASASNLQSLQHHSQLQHQPSLSNVTSLPASSFAANAAAVAAGVAAAPFTSSSPIAATATSTSTSVPQTRSSSNPQSDLLGDWVLNQVLFGNYTSPPQRPVQSTADNNIAQLLGLFSSQQQNQKQ
ncbi:hypothetical protein GQ42DRAFT_153871 [Ramicandelaber brevisporus]|nr:hypothetical protein GQ42DRAFT_153871 [Ramicandelaber brevisporus]